MGGDLHFRPIELPRDAEVCVRNRADSYAVSFGSPQRFYDENGADGAGYLAWIQARTQDQGTCVLALSHGEVVGQIEAQHLAKHRAAYVYLYYVVPSQRRKGLGAQLDEYVTRLFAARGCRELALTVSASNANAIAFYRARGWLDAGPRRDRPDERRMERKLCPDSDGLAP